MGRDLRLDIGVAVEGGKALIPSGFILQSVGCPVLRTERAAFGAVDDDPLQIRHRFVVVVQILLVLGRIGPEYVVDITRHILEFHICYRESADIATSASERHPGRGGILAALVQHLWQPIRQYIGPVSERAREARDTVLVEEPETIADRD